MLYVHALSYRYCKHLHRLPTPYVSHPSISFSKNPGSFSTLLSNFAHQSIKLFNGTISSSFGPTVPEKLARKLNAFLIIRCASTFVCKGPAERCLEDVITAVCDEEEAAAWPPLACSDSRRASCGAIVAIGSMDIPMVISPGEAGGRASSSSIISSSAAKPSDQLLRCFPLPLPLPIWRMALCFSLLKAPRSLNSEVELEKCTYMAASVSRGRFVPGRRKTTI